MGYCNKKTACTAIFKKGGHIQHNFVPKAFTSLTHGRHESLIKAFVPTKEFCDLIDLGVHSRVHSINCFRNEFAFDSNLVMTQLRSSNFPDSSQVCSCSAFMQEKLELMHQTKFTIYRSKSQDGDF